MANPGIDSRRRFLRNAAVVIAATDLTGSAAIAAKFGDEGSIPDLDGAVAWLNSAPLTSKALRSTLQEPPGKVVFRFHARGLHMVLGRAKNSALIRFKVTLDGVAPSDNHGVDSCSDGSGEIREPRMYQLVWQKGQVQDCTFEIEFLDPGAEIFSFTFG